MLRQLYADTEGLRHDSFYVIPPDADDESSHHFVARFEPADLVTIRQACLPNARKSFPFASDDFGNDYCFDLSAQSFCVHSVDHDGGEISPVADQLEAFLGWKKRSDTRHSI